MAKEKFRTVAFKPDSLKKIRKMNEIIEEYQGQGQQVAQRRRGDFHGNEDDGS